MSLIFKYLEIKVFYSKKDQDVSLPHDNLRKKFCLPF